MEQTQRGDPEDARVAGERAEAIGAYLGRQRRLRGISIEELSATTRIPVRSLQRLEKGAFDAVRDGFALTEIEPALDSFESAYDGAVTASAA